MDFFSGTKAKWLPLYKELKASAQEMLGAFEERENSSAVVWKHSSSFAEISAKRACLTVAFSDKQAHDDWEPSKIVQTSKNRFAHYFDITDNASFPFLIDGIKASFELSKTLPPKKEAPIADFKTVDEYIGSFDGNVKEILEKTKVAIADAIPDAIEKIAWQMPTFYNKENLIHFAAGKSHLGIYPGASGVEAFKERLTGYKISKGAIQFPYKDLIPYGLIAEIAKFRAEEAAKRA
jgi:uncharacterized protein YdhG (YjbR/CyaY superfamily)